MLNTNLLTILKEKSRINYENFLKTMEVGKVTAEEEAEFFKTAPDDWIADYISVTYPQPASERILMVSGSEETLKKSYDLWGFWDENVNWAFACSTEKVCKRIISCMSYYPGYEAENLMLNRNSNDLLKLWVEKYKTLSEESEKRLHEELKLAGLKESYILSQIDK